MLPLKIRKYNGFTLIELLVVLTILALLAVSVFVALNPSQRLKDSQDSRRAADVNSILTAIHQSIVDNKGNLPTNLPKPTPGVTDGTEVQLGTAATGCALTSTSTNPSCNVTQVSCVDLMSGAQNLSSYLKTMPYDPILTSNATTGYSVYADKNGIIQVKACDTSASTTISAAR